MGLVGFLVGGYTVGGTSAQPVMLLGQDPDSVTLFMVLMMISAGALLGWVLFGKRSG